MLYKKDLINLLDISGCDYFIKEHEALYTVEDSKALRGTISGAHSKNLFLIKACNPKFTPHREFSLKRPPVLFSLNEINKIGFLKILTNAEINFASVKVD